MVSASSKLRFGVRHEKVNFCSVLMESPLIANGAEISRIDDFVKIEKKTNEKSRRLGKI
jgi:hypothetical protein